MAVILLTLSISAFAVDISAGIGASGGYFINEMKTSTATPDVSSETTITYVPFGIIAFFDATYFQGSGGYLMLTNSYEKMTVTVSGSPSTLIDQPIVGSKSFLCFAAYAKYPFALGPLTLFPILGIEFDLNIIAIDANGNDLRASMTDQQKSDANKFWLKGGFGADISFSSKAYIRPALIVGYKLPNVSENNALISAQQAGFDVLLAPLTFDLNLLIGYRF